MRYRFVGSLGASAVVALLGTLLPNAPAAEPTAAEKALMARVSKRLVEACDPVPGFEWPPDFGIAGKGINAEATLGRKDGKLYPIIRVTPAMMSEVIQGDEHRLALVLGHELGHILHRHVVPQEFRDRTPFLRNTFGRQQEIQADFTGVELMGKAGFSFATGKKAILRMKELGLDYASFEGLSTDHPSWDNRLVLIDKSQAKVWHSLSAFRNGVVFLAAEQYPAAERCFYQVTLDFPKCHEAWVNLGYARLMQYCDKLDIQDLRDFGIGQVFTGGFYLRAESIPVRGKDLKLWTDAVAALRKALEINPALTLAKADLGLAYLVHPMGKEAGEAAKLLQEAADLARADKSLDPTAHAALLVNLGVANLGGAEADKGMKQLEEGERLGLALGPDARAANPALDAALLYNRAIYLAARKDADSQKQALDLLEKYLGTSSPLSLWWPLAYERYEALCKAQGKQPRARATFMKARPETVRPVTGVTLRSGKEVTLGEDVEVLIGKLGKGRETVVTPRTNLRRYCYEKEGVEVLTANEVLAVCLTTAQSPAIPLRGRGVGAEKKAELRVGMTFKEVEDVLGNAYYHRPHELTTEGIYYQYFPAQGVAVRLDKSKSKVLEVVVVQLPKQNKDQ